MTDEDSAEVQSPTKDYRDPPWMKVWLTSVRLLIQRSPLRVLAASAALGIAVAVTAVSLVPTRQASSTDTGAQSPGRATDPLAAAAAVREDAARWAAANVAAGTLIACDPSMCIDLEAAGYLVTALVPIRSSGGDLRRADLVLMTPALRAQVGDGFDDLVAAEAVAAFGSGRVAAALLRVTLDGPDGYERRAAGDRAARAAAGRQLADADGLDLSATARTQLERGDVDARILSVLPPLLARHELSILRFTVAPEEPSGAALRMVEIDRIDGDAITPGYATVSEVVQFLDAQRPPFLPASVDVVAVPVGSALRIAYSAPSQVGLLDGLASSLED